MSQCLTYMAYIYIYYMYIYICVYIYNIYIYICIYHMKDVPMTGLAVGAASGATAGALAGGATGAKGELWACRVATAFTPLLIKYDWAGKSPNQVEAVNIALQSPQLLKDNFKIWRLPYDACHVSGGYQAYNHRHEIRASASKTLEQARPNGSTQQSIQWLQGSQRARGTHIPEYCLFNGEPLWTA